MRVLLRFTIFAVLVFIIADIVPFPNYPNGYILTQFNQHNKIIDDN